MILPVALPILCGVLLFPVSRKGERALCVFAETGVILTSVLVWVFFFTIDPSARTVYFFTQGFAINFHLDGLSRLFAGMVSLMWPIVMIYAFAYMDHNRRKTSFFGFFTMTYGITLGVCFAADILTLYVFFEMLTLITIPLVSHFQDHESMYAGRKYAAYVIGGASLSFIAVVLATVDGSSGTFVFGGNLGGHFSPLLMQVIYLFGFFGFGVKAAIVPLHGWLPTASVAPTPVTALLHAVAVVNTGVFSIVRLTYYTFGPELIRGTYVQTLCLLVISFSLVYSALMALRERHFKRRLANSTISNLSYMLFGILLLSPLGLVAGLAHMVFHGIIKLALFMCAGSFMHETGKEYLYDVTGAGKVMPRTFALYTLNALSLTGIPLLCGFVSKWYLITAGIAEGSVAAIIGTLALIAASFLCAIYTLSVSARAFFPSKANDHYAGQARGREGGWKMLVPILIFSVANVVFGVAPGGLLTFLNRIAEGIL